MISRTSFITALVGWLTYMSSLSSLQAQGVAMARISGTLTDDSGAVLFGATVQAKNVERGNSRSTVTDSRGRFAIADLPIGSYDVRASSPGFDPVSRSPVGLTVGADLVIDFTLKVGQARQEVIVDAQVSPVETQSGAVSSLVTSEQLHNLPLNGRNFEQLIALVPGVSAAASSVLQVSATPSNPVYGNQNNFSVSGSRPEGIAFLLDNTDISDFFNRGTGSGVAGTSLGVDAIAEFQVLTNTYSAQFGGTGAVVNIASKAGTNQLHGTAYEYLRNNDLDSRGYFDVNSTGQPAGPPPYRRNQFGGSLGGLSGRTSCSFSRIMRAFSLRLARLESPTSRSRTSCEGRFAASILKSPRPEQPLAPLAISLRWSQMFLQRRPRFSRYIPEPPLQPPTWEVTLHSPSRLAWSPQKGIF